MGPASDALRGLLASTPGKQDMGVGSNSGIVTYCASNAEQPLDSHNDGDNDGFGTVGSTLASSWCSTRDVPSPPRKMAEYFDPLSATAALGLPLGHGKGNHGKSCLASSSSPASVSASASDPSSGGPHASRQRTSLAETVLAETRKVKEMTVDSSELCDTST